MKFFITVPEISVWLDAPDEEHIEVETSWKPPMFAGFNIKKPDELWAKDVIPKLPSYHYRDRYIDPLIEELKDGGEDGDVVVINFESLEYYDHEDETMNPIVHYQSKKFGTSTIGLTNDFPEYVEIPFDHMGEEFRFRCLSCNAPLVSRETYQNPYYVRYILDGKVVRANFTNFSAVVCKCGSRYDATPTLDDHSARLVHTKIQNKQPELF
jgi:hypothetical protein